MAVTLSLSSRKSAISDILFFDWFPTVITKAMGRHLFWIVRLITMFDECEIIATP